MERTQIYLTHQQAAALDREAQRTGTTRSHLIREAIDQAYLTSKEADEVTAALNASFGAWNGERETGQEYVDHIRADRRLHELWDEPQE